MTPELARAATVPLEQALWLQNERLYEQLRSRFRSRFRPRLRLAGILLALVGVGLSLLGWTQDPGGESSFPVFAAAFVAFAIVFAFLPTNDAGLRRFTRRMVTHRARRMMERVAVKAPYVIEYSLAINVLTARVEKLGFSRLLDLRTIRVAVKARNFIVAFTRPYSTRPMRLLYFPSPTERDQVLQALVEPSSADDHYVVVMPSQGRAGFNVPARLSSGGDGEASGAGRPQAGPRSEGEPSLVLTSACLVQTYRRSACSDDSVCPQRGDWPVSSQQSEPSDTASQNGSDISFSGALLVAQLITSCSRVG